MVIGRRGSRKTVHGVIPLSHRRCTLSLQVVQQRHGSPDTCHLHCCNRTLLGHELAVQSCLSDHTHVTERSVYTARACQGASGASWCGVHSNVYLLIPQSDLWHTGSGICGHAVGPEHLASTAPASQLSLHNFVCGNVLELSRVLGPPLLGNHRKSPWQAQPVLIPRRRRPTDSLQVAVQVR